MWATLVKHAGIAGEIVALFHARFDPRADAAGRARRQKKKSRRASRKQLQAGRKPGRRPHPAPLRQCRAVGDPHQFLSRPTKTAQPKPLIAVKFDSGKLTDLPLPRPLYEIFVYSPRVEGVHLRFGKVARGGIRWSDRPQDFRTEILGLVKAQQVKNAVIVPVGAKGGFVPKLMPKACRRARQFRPKASPPTSCSSRRCSTSPTISRPTARSFRRTDVVRHEGDDPYLVVAADKGTATFSDIANEISARARLLAGRRFRLRRLGRLRPQGDGHHRARRLGIGQAAFPRDGRRYRRDAVHAWSASATCRATCSATACCARTPSSCSPPSTIATFSSIPIPTRRRASPNASACSICRARAGRTTTRR